jgi:EmrB/QacA subfamily drug resistance transporter
VINAYTLTFGGLLLLGARAGDILGRRRTFLAGITLFTLASLVGGLAATSGELLAARAVQGIGAALAAPSALALLMTMFPQGRERTRAIGLYTAVSVGGSAVGLIAGGMLTQWVSWRWVLFVNVPIGVAVIALSRLVLPETPRRSGRFDLTGALTSTIGMTALVYGLVHAASDGWVNTATIASFTVGVVLLAAFVFNELRAPSPITPLRLFADRNRSTSYLARLLLAAGMLGMFFFLTQFLQNLLGYSPLKTGFAFLPLTAMLFAASTLSARILVERFGNRAQIAGGITLSTGGLLWLTQLSETSSYLSVLGPLLLFGLGTGISFVPLTTAALNGVAPEDAGAASGLVNVMQQLGGSLGLAVLVTVFGTASTNAARHVRPGEGAAEVARHAFMVGADRAFFVAAILLAATVLLTFFALRPTAPQTTDAQASDDPTRRAGPSSPAPVTVEA